MPSKSMNQLKKDKAFKTIAVFAMVFLFVASFLMAIVLPFADTVGVAEASSASLSAENEPAYADGVGKGNYIDFSFTNSVSMYDYNGTDTVYGFYYDTSYKFDFDFRDNTALTGNLKSYSISFREGGRSWYSFTILNAYSSVGANNYARLSITFPYGTSTNSADFNLMYYSKTDTRFNITYVQNGYYFDRGFNEVVFKADFKTTEYAKHMYLLTEPYKLGGGESWSPSAFSSTFVTMAQTPSPSVFVNMVSYPTLPDYSLFVNDNGVYGFELFDTYTTDGSAMGFYGRLNTGWQYEAKFNGVGPTATLSHWIVSLYVGFSLVYSCKVTPGQGSTTASQFNNGTISEQTWHVPRSFDFGDLPIYEYSSSNGGYMHILKSSSTVGSWQFGTNGWSNYIALFDLRNGFDKDTSGLYNAGVAEGQGNLAQAKEDSYNKGYSEGSSVGYNKGYSAGVNDSNQYTFMSLIGAVFDAPISAFRGLFSFEILGVDMTAFVSSLFALAVIVVIIKIALGGGK